MVSIARLKDLWLGLQNPRSDGYETAGVLALATFGFLAFQGHAGAKFGLLCLLLATVVRWRGFFNYVRRDPLFHLACILAVYLAVRAWAGAQSLPGTGWRQLEAAVDLGVIGFSVVMLSWWLRGEPRRVALLATLAIAGLCMELIVDDLRMVDVQAVLAGGHRGLLGSALPRALIAAIGLLVLITALPTMLQAARRKSRGAMALVAVGAVFIVLLLGLVQIITQSRAVIGLFTVLAPVVVIVQMLRPIKERCDVKSMVATGLILVALLGGVIGLVGPNLVAKMDREIDQVLPYLGTEDLSQMPPSSLGWRVQLIDLGLKIGMDRPWFGWGTGTSAVIDLSERYDSTHLYHLQHLHNFPLEIWARLGILGVVMYLLMVILLVRSLVSSTMNSRAPPDVVIAIAACGLLMGGYALIEFRMLAWDFNSAFIMLAAAAYTFGPNQAHVRDDS